MFKLGNLRNQTNTSINEDRPCRMVMTTIRQRGARGKHESRTLDPDNDGRVGIHVHGKSSWSPASRRAPAAAAAGEYQPHVLWSAREAAEMHSGGAEKMHYRSRAAGTGGRFAFVTPNQKGRVPRGDMRSGCAPANVCYGMPSVPARMCYAPGKVV